MRKRFAEYGLLIAFIVVFIYGINAQYPLIGEDYMYVFPRLLEGRWHFLRQGFAPLRYAPHLCGGFPQYGNPQDHFYSIPQVLSLFLDLWTAMQISIVAMIIIGYFGWKRFGKDVLRLSEPWQKVLAIVCSVNGFYFMHTAVGHMWALSMPLLSWILWLILLPGRESMRRLVMRSLGFALIMASIVYSGSQTLLLLALLLVLSIIIPDILLSERSFERILTLTRRCVSYGIATLILCASKLVAVYSLFSTLDIQATFSGYHSGQSILWFAAKSFWALPQSPELFRSVVTFSRIHEESMYTPHMALLGCIALLSVWMKNRVFLQRKKIALLFYAVLLSIFILLLIRGTGAVPEALQMFPIFSSLRVPERFLLILSLLLSLMGVYGAALYFRRSRWKNHEWHITSVISLLSILGFALAYVPLMRSGNISLTLPYDVIEKLESNNKNYLTSPVLYALEMEEGMRVSDFQYLYFSSTGTQCYEAIPRSLPKLRNGPITQIYDGAYNIYNPACLQYPTENFCEPGDRIREDDRENLIAFAHGRKTSWKVSRLQTIADRVTGVGFILTLAVLFFVSLRKIYRVLFNNSSL